MRPAFVPALALATMLGGGALAAQPPKPAHSKVDDKACTFEWKTGAGIGVWAERCTLSTGVWELKYRADLPGFALTIDGGDEQVVIQVFRKPADKPIDAILPDLVKRGYIKPTECAFALADEQVTGAPPAGRHYFEVDPTGARKAAFDALPDDEVPDPPCGDYGMAPDGITFFMTDDAHPDRVVYLNLGQDGTMFDERTVTFE
ncbi:MAG TPA: hypothetical protein VFB16_09540 [Bauldia sp.]|nr:hypothetical protein [Bauldia sp.]